MYLYSQFNYGIYTNMKEQEDVNKEFDERFTFREWDTYDLGEDAQLDKYALDLEAENQAHLYLKWSELLVQAQAQVSKLKEVVQNKEAELILKAKEEGIPGIDKPTEAAIKSWVITQSAYKRNATKKRKAENDVAYLQNALKVLEHKRTMIKIEADLWITGYYARPHVTDEMIGELEESRRKHVSNQIERSLTKRHLRQKEE